MQNHTVRDRVAFRSSLTDLKVPAFNVLHALQDQPRDIQIDAIFLAATLLAEGAELDPHEMVSRAFRQIDDARRVRNDNLDAIQDYAQGELR